MEERTTMKREEKAGQKAERRLRREERSEDWAERREEQSQWCGKDYVIGTNMNLGFRK